MYTINYPLPGTKVFNSVLMNSNGTIQQVHTTYFQNCVSIQGIDKYITLYTFSPLMARMFKEGVSQRFCEDNGEPDDLQHSVLQEVILSGSDFIHQSKNDYHIHYAELVIHANKSMYSIEDLVKTLYGVLKMCNKWNDCLSWKTFAWRTYSTPGQEIVAVSIEKLSMAN